MPRAPSRVAAKRMRVPPVPATDGALFTQSATFCLQRVDTSFTVDWNCDPDADNAGRARPSHTPTACSPREADWQDPPLRERKHAAPGSRYNSRCGDVLSSTRAGPFCADAGDTPGVRFAPRPELYRFRNNNVPGGQGRPPQPERSPHARVVATSSLEPKALESSGVPPFRLTKGTAECRPAPR